MALLQCPDCYGQFNLKNTVEDQGEIKEGMLCCQACNVEYAIVNFIPRIVEADNYAKGFGFQWNTHTRTQIDKYNGTQITHDRFYNCSGWDKEELAGESIFEAGCGAGRFTQIMLDAGMEVFSLDYSSAVDACFANHGLHPNLHIVQGSIYSVPYAPARFDRVFCFGVMQHTPDVKKTFNALVDLVKPGGRIAVDVYPKTLKSMLHYPRYVLRPLAKRLPPATLYKLVEIAVDTLLPISIFLKQLPFIGRYLYPLIPVANYWGTHPLSRQQLREWSILDTFDWLGSWYDQPQTAETLQAWFEECELVNCTLRDMGSFVGTGEKAELL